MSEIVETVLGFIPLLKDIAITVAAIVASFVGIKGLDTWRRQLRGNAEYALAKNIITSTYELREAIAAGRNPNKVWFAERLDLTPEEFEALSPEEHKYLAMTKAYKNRWGPIAAASTKLRATLFEAETVWGKDVANYIRTLIEISLKFFRTIQKHLRLLDPDNENKRPSFETDNEIRAVLYEGLAEPDEFKDQLNDAIRSIEIALKPHITQHHN